jgi:hypothetical protein
VADTFETDHQLEVDKSADEVWEWRSNIGNATTINQFHLELDCDPVDFHNPRVGLEVPIVHEIFGSRHVRLARIMKYGD